LITSPSRRQFDDRTIGTVPPQIKRRRCQAALELPAPEIARDIGIFSVAEHPGLLQFAMFRAPLVAVKATVMTALSVGAAYGVIVAVFQWGWGLSLLGLDDPVPIMSLVPMLLFAVLFGLSMDYEVFLLSAIREGYRDSG
jgi:hypothetical protein